MWFAQEGIVLCLTEYTEPQLLAFVKRVLQAESEADGVASVLALIANCPPHSWSDADVERFPEACKAIGNNLKHATLLEKEHAVSVRIKDLSQKEKKQAKSLLKELKAQLIKKDKKYPPRIIEAVITELLNEFHQKRHGENG